MKKQDVKFIEKRLERLEQTADEIEDMHLEVRCFTGEIKGRIKKMKKEAEHGNRKKTR